MWFGSAVINRKKTASAAKTELSSFLALIPRYSSADAQSDIVQLVGPHIMRSLYYHFSKKGGTQLRGEVRFMCFSAKPSPGQMTVVCRYAARSFSETKNGWCCQYGTCFAFDLRLQWFRELGERVFELFPTSKDPYHRQLTDKCSVAKPVLRASASARAPAPAVPIEFPLR